MKAFRWVTDGERVEIITLYEGGFSIRQVAKLVGRPFTTVHSVLTREGVEIRPSYGQPGSTRIPHAEIEKVIFMYDNMKMSTTEIDKLMGWAVGAALIRLRLAGFPRRDRVEAARLSYRTGRKSYRTGRKA